MLSTVKPVYNSLGYNENSLLTKALGHIDEFIINGFNCNSVQKFFAEFNSKIWS